MEATVGRPWFNIIAALVYIRRAHTRDACSDFREVTRHTQPKQAEFHLVYQERSLNAPWLRLVCSFKIEERRPPCS